jgi:hypothetical protein
MPLAVWISLDALGWQTCAELNPIKSGELQAGYSAALLNF